MDIQALNHSTDEVGIDIDQDNTVDTAATSEENVVPASEENLIGCVDITGYLIGLTRKTIDDMYQMYCQHARSLGFSVRKSTSRYSSDEVVVEKYFTCSCGGEKNSKISSDASATEIIKKSRVTRTGCKASLRVKLNDESLYEVVNHIMLHNHPITRKEWNHLHRSERNDTNEKGKTIEDMICSGMRASDSFRYMVHNAGENKMLVIQ